ncbi:penicillin-insensitive murein endopeptidase [Rhodopila sp.]|uniref:penicillin-insensitive murein endopeptidase n=1 Tax=Rhodopila sp. TaxID=2480087 RepID=UPI003D1346D2
MRLPRVTALLTSLAVTTAAHPVSPTTPIPISAVPPLASAALPAPGPLHIIGGPSTGGCIAGAVSLPPQGAGFQTIHLDRSAFWGAPQTIADLRLFGREAEAAGLPTLLIEDISRARGGPLPGGHVSHQIGLDVDVGLDMRPRPPLSASDRESVVLRSMVRPDGRDVDPAAWSPAVVSLLHIAAGLPEVDRILVNPAIKQQLCRQVSGDRSWLHLIRPWYGHAAHMHIRFRCPAGQADCAQAPPPPRGDGCGPTLQWWFDQLNAPAKPSEPYRPPPLPSACQAILAG